MCATLTLSNINTESLYSVEDGAMKTHNPKKCDICGEIFIPRNSAQHSCCKTLNLICPICGESYTTTCSADKRKTCSNPECRKHAASICEPTERSCKGCGEKFITTKLGQVYCNREKTKVCPVCGKVFSYVCNNSVRATCSESCQATFIKEKRRKAIASEIRICKWCGKEFHPKEVRDVYCDGPHYKKCAICGKEFEIDVRKDQNVETCSSECKGILMSRNHDYIKGHETQKRVLMEKYGVENSASVPGAKEKQKATTLAKYGKEWYTQTDEYKERVKYTRSHKHK